MNEMQQSQQQEAAPQKKGPEPGKKLMAGYAKAQKPCGEEGHYCLDPQGKYKPDWVQLYINRDQLTPASLPFVNGKTKENFLLPTGLWVDCPAWVVTNLQNCIETITEDDPNADPRTHNYQPLSTRTKRRFFFDKKPSR